MNVAFLLGRRDQPTDALQDYCERLARALAARGHGARLVRLSWAEEGWPGALRKLWREINDVVPSWVLFQYTALQWSRRGWPLAAPAVVWALRRRGVRVACVFHDSGPYPPRPGIGPPRRVWDRLRRIAQRLVMRALASLSSAVILTVPENDAAWLPVRVARVVSIPVGPNVTDSECALAANPQALPAVAVYALTGPPSLASEVEAIAHAVRAAARQVAGLKLIALGRNSDLAAEPLRKALSGSGVELQVLGVVPPEAVTTALMGASVLLFVRGQVSSRRGSAVTALACGLPIVGYVGSETGPPLTEAGVSLVPLGDRNALAGALVRVLIDPVWHATLRQRSAEAFRKHFSWSAIADRLVSELGGV